MDNQHKINDFIKLAESNELCDVCFECIDFMNKPYYRIHFRHEGYKGTINRGYFDISYDSFCKVSNETIIKEIRGFKING